MDTKKLRQKILDLAIRGKLVPQDPNDEPASVLLERIRAEKERLIKEGKIKRSKNTASDDEIEAPFEIPESWEWVRLDELCDIKGGKRIPRCMNFSKVPTEHVYLRVTNMKSHTIVENEIKYIDEEVFQIIKNYTISSNDLYLTIAGTIGDVGVIPLKFSNMNLTENAAKLTNLHCDKLFLMYALLSTIAQNHFSSKFHQVAQPKLSIETASSAIIALPPIAEQKRIANEIGGWFAVLDVLESNEGDLLKAVDQVKSKILDLAIHGKLVPQDPNDEPAIELLKRIREDKNQLVKEGKLKKKDLEVKPISDEEIPFEIPESWEWVRLKSIASKIVDGDHNPPSGLSSDSGYYMLSSKNIDNDNIVISDDARFLSFEDWRKCNDRTNLRKGDILLTTVATLGRSCVYEDNVPYCFQRSVSIIHTFIINYFLKYCFDSPYYQSLIDDKATGTAQRGFYLNQLEESIIPVPPLAEQLRIVAKMKELSAIIDSIKKSLE